MEKIDLEIQLLEAKKLIIDVHIDLASTYKAECESANWYNNNMLHVGTLLDYQRAPEKSKSLLMLEEYFKDEK